MRSEEFWELTWYDFGLWCLKIQRDVDARKFATEEQRELMRHLMALTANIHSKRTFKPSDFYQIVEERKVNAVDDPELMAKMKKKFGSSVKKKKRG